MNTKSKGLNRSRLAKAIAGAALIGSFVAVSPGCNEIPFMGASSDYAQELIDTRVFGRAIDAKILGGDLTVYSYVNGARGQKLTDTVQTSEEDGSFDVSIAAPKQPIILEIEGGYYFEEASGKRIDLQDGDKLRAVTFHQPGTPLNVYVTPFTNIAAGLATYKIKNGEIVENAITEANSAITNIVGVDILGTDPKNITDLQYSNQSLDDGLRYGFHIAAISGFTANQSIVNGFEPHEEHNYTSISFHDISYRDVTSDGQLDGVGIAQNSTNFVRLGMGVTEFDQNTYRAGLARQMLAMTTNKDVNKTSIDAEELIYDAQSLAQNGSQLFDGMVFESLDDEPPVIQSTSHYQKQYVAGDVEFNVAADDFTGIKSLSFELNGVVTEAADLMAPSFKFNSNLLADGSHIITVRAKDAMNNEQVYEHTLSVVNSGPLVTLLSPRLASDEYYNLHLAVSDLGQGIKTVTVNGEDTVIDGLDVTGNIRLSSGTNTLDIQVVDGTDTTYNYELEVGLDAVTPKMTVEIPRAFSGYSVYYVQSGQSPTLSDFSELSASNPPLLVSQSTRELGGAAINESNIQSKRIPYFKVIVSDLDEYSQVPVETPVEELKLLMTFKYGNSVIFEDKELPQNGIEAGQYIVPLTSEVLGPLWYQQESGTTNYIDLKVVDAAGNTKEYNNEFTFKIQYAEPVVGAELTEADIFSGEMEIDLSDVDTSAMAEVTYTIDGEDFIAPDPKNPSMTFDSEQWDDGVHTVVITMLDEYNNVYQKEMQFTVDNTAPVINISSQLMVGKSSYSLEGNVSDAISVIKFVDIDGDNVDSLEITGDFKHALNLNSGSNPVMVSAGDDSNNSQSKPVNILLDDAAPIQNEITPSTTSVFQTFYTDNDGNPVKGEFRNNASEALYITPGRATLAGLTATTQNLSALSIPYLHFNVEDVDAAPGSGAYTNKQDLVVDYTYKVGSETITENQAMNPFNDNGEYLLPLSSEYLGSRWLTFNESATHNIKFKVTDLVGNTKEVDYSFKVNYEQMPYTIQDLELQWFKDNITLDFGDLSAFALVDTKVEADGKDVLVSDPTTHPVAVIDSTLMDDGLNKISFYVEDRVGRIDEEHEFVNIDNTAPIVNLTADLITNTSPLSVSGLIDDGEAGVSSGMDTITLNGSSVKSSWDSASSQFDRNVSLSKGTNTLAFVAADKLGSATTQTFNTIFDPDAPVLTFTKNTPDVTNLPTAEFTVRGYDELTEIDASGVYNGSNIPQNTDLNVNKVLVEGPNDFTQTLTDEAGNSVTQLLSVIKDTNGPVMVKGNGCAGITNIASCSYNLSSVTDEYLPMRDVKYYVNGVQQSSEITSSFTQSKTLTFANNGKQVVTAIAADDFGNTSSVQWDDLYVDTVAPNMSWNSVPSTITTASYTFGGSCVDASSNGYASEVNYLKIKGSTVSCSGGLWSKSVSLVHGSNTISGQIFDKAGNSTTVNKTVNTVLDNEGPHVDYSDDDIFIEQGNFGISKIYYGSTPISKTFTFNLSASDISGVINTKVNSIERGIFRRQGPSVLNLENGKDDYTVVSDTSVANCHAQLPSAGNVSVLCDFNVPYTSGLPSSDQYVAIYFYKIEVQLEDGVGNSSFTDIEVMVNNQDSSYQMDLSDTSTKNYVLDYFRNN